MRINLHTLQLTFVLVSVTAAAAQAQSAEGQIYQPLYVAGVTTPWGGYHHASTAAEGYLRGSADYLRAMGEYNVNTSLAARNWEEAYSRSLDNRVKHVETYFESRRINEKYRAQRRKPPTAEEIAKWNAARRPRRLTAEQFDPLTGEIHWPEILSESDFESARKMLEKCFSSGTKSSRQSTRNSRQVQTSIEQMRKLLAQSRHELSPRDYVEAKKFLDSLAYETRFLSHSDAVAAR
jgi:hypothetical protein